MKKIKKYKRKIYSSVISVCFSICTFIYCLSGFGTPVYAEDNWYWDGVIYSTTSSTVEVNGVNNYVNAGYRLRFNYRPDYAYAVTLAPQYSGGGFEYVWYVGRYSESSTPTDVAVFVLKLEGYIDSVAAGSIGYTSSKIAKNRYYGFNVQVGSGYDWYVGYCTDSSQYFKSKLNHNMIVLSNSYATSASTVKLHLETALGYNANYSRFKDKSSPDAGFLYTNTSAASGDYSDYRFAPNIYTAFSNEVITPSLYPNGEVVPGTGYADGSNGTGGSDGSGNDSGSGGSGSSGGSVNIEEGAISQQQQQQQQIEEGAIQNSQTIESNAITNTVSPNAINNTITVNGGSGGSGADQTVSGLEQAATGGWFDNLESAFSGVNQMINQLKNMPKLITGLFAFLPNELLNAITIMFGIMIPIVLIKVLV